MFFEKTFECSTSKDCNGTGTCVHGECLCDVGWFDDDCTDNLKLKWPGAFYTFRVIFLILYAAVALYIILRLHHKISKESKMLDKKKRKVFLVGMKSPLNLVFRVLLLLCITQILWLAIDPFVYNHVLHRTVERLLFESSFSFTFIIYAIVLWVWYSIYEELSYSGRRKRSYFNWARLLIIGFVIFLVSAQIITSILKGFRGNTNRHIAVGLYALIFSIELICIACLSLYATRLYKLVKAKEKAFEERTPKSYGPSSSAIEEPHYRHSKLAKQNKVSSGGKLNSSQSLIFKTQKTGSMNEDNFNQLEIVLPRTLSSDIPKMPSLKKMQSMPMKTKSILFEPMLSQPALDDDVKDRLDHKIQELQEKNKYDVIFEDEEELLEKESQIQRIRNVKEDLGAPLPRLNPRLMRAATTVVTNTWNERKIREILKRDEEYFKPIKKREICYNIDSDIPIIITNTKGFEWDVPEEEKSPREEERKKEEKEESLEKVKREFLPSLNTTKLNNTSFSLEVYEKKLLEDPEYVMHQKQVIKSDEAIIKRIVGQTTLAIIFGGISALLNLLVYVTDIFESPAGIFIFSWFYEFLTIASIIVILALFSLARNQEKENLRLISRMGQNKSRINKIHAFVLPDYLRKEDSKVRFEKQINYVTTGNINFLPANSFSSLS